MQSYFYTLVDVFTRSPLAGNQLAVFGEADSIPESMLLPLARELNLPETVFLYSKRPDGSWPIRIFTAALELSFAGHPIIGAAFVLARSSGSEMMRFLTGKGPIEVNVTKISSSIFDGWMTQPVPIIVPYIHSDALIRDLKISESFLPVESYDNGLETTYVALRDTAELSALKPDFALLRSCGLPSICCFARRGATWHSRVFMPYDPVPEDPATGSAAGPLALHLVRHNIISIGEYIYISQGEEIGRPSTLVAKVGKSPGHELSIHVGGEGLIVGKGQIDDVGHSISGQL